MNKILLLAGNDIPFEEAQLIIHQPKIKEVAYLGEKAFFTGCGFLDFSKDLLEEKDKIRLANLDDFDILMSIMISGEKAVRFQVNSALSVLFILFPQYKINVRKECIVLVEQDGTEKQINQKNFPFFKKILEEMFFLNIGEEDKKEFNPNGSMSEKIAEKLRKRHEQLAKLAKDQIDNKKDGSILHRYASILSVGLQKDLNDLMQYTIYQLLDSFQRFQLKVQWDAYIQARMAGAKDLEEVDNWMIDLSDIGKNKNKNKK